MEQGSHILEHDGGQLIITFSVSNERSPQLHQLTL